MFQSAKHTVHVQASDDITPQGFNTKDKSQSVPLRYANLASIDGSPGLTEINMTLGNSPNAKIMVGLKRLQNKYARNFPWSCARSDGGCCDEGNTGARTIKERRKRG